MVVQRGAWFSVAVYNAGHTDGNIETSLRAALRWGLSLQI